MRILMFLVICISTLSASAIKVRAHVYIKNSEMVELYIKAENYYNYYPVLIKSKIGYEGVKGFRQTFSFNDVDSVVFVYEDTIRFTFVPVVFQEVDVDIDTGEEIINNQTYWGQILYQGHHELYAIYLRKSDQYGGSYLTYDECYRVKGEAVVKDVMKRAVYRKYKKECPEFKESISDKKPIDFDIVSMFESIDQYCFN